MKYHIALVWVLALTSCDDGLGPSEVGTARYFGELLWETPSRVMPPIRDRDGNVYIGLSEPNNVGCSLADGDVFIGFAGGGFGGGCSDTWLREGTRRNHGWVGYGDSQAWFWAGDSLVNVSGKYGFCVSLLDKDPVTRADIDFVSVVPWLWDRPTRRTMVAMIQTPSDELPYHVVVDVDSRIYFNERQFQPSDATDVVSVGVGGNRSERIGVMFVWYDQAGTGHLVAIFLDERGKETGRTEVVGVSGASAGGASASFLDASVGFAAVTEGGHAAILLQSGELIFATKSTSSVNLVTDMTPQGVQLWDNQLWLVGDDAGTPVIAEISPSGSIGPKQTWNTSLELAAKFSGSIDVLDERVAPRKRTKWTGADTAIGAHPLVAPFSLSPYATESAGWVVGGPSFTSGTGNQCRSIAFVPVGVSYP